MIKNGDLIEININERSINLLISQQELKIRKQEELNKNEKAYCPTNRNRNVSKALQIYAKHVSSADKGAIREL